MGALVLVDIITTNAMATASTRQACRTRAGAANCSHSLTTRIAIHSGPTGVIGRSGARGVGPFDDDDDGCCVISDRLAAET